MKAPAIILIPLLAAPAAFGEPADVATAEECPALFGDETEHAADEVWRERVVRLVEETGDDVLIVHSAGWAWPAPLDLIGATVVATADRDDGEPMGLLQLSPEAAPTGCRPGLYAVEAGDRLGQARVLAVLDDLILVEHDGSLRYLQGGEGQPPSWRMVWRSPWRFPKPERPAVTRRRTTKTSRKSRRR